MEINLNDKKYTIPERLTIEQWQNLVKWDFQRPEHWPRILNIATGAPWDLLRKCETDPLELGVHIVISLMSEREQYGMKDPNEILFGEWIDLEIALQGGIDKNLSSIVNLLDSDTEWADEALWIIDTYIKWRTSLYKQYSNLFGLNERVDEDEEEDGVKDPRQLSRQWYRIICDLADYDLLKIDQIVAEPLIKTLNFMALRKQMQLEENEKIQQQQRNYDLQRTRK